MQKHHFQSLWVKFSEVMHQVFLFCISIRWFTLVAAPDGVDLNSDENLGHLYLTVWFIHPPLHSIVTHDES